jgi:hypothetical protein
LRASYAPLFQPILASWARSSSFRTAGKFPPRFFGSSRDGQRIPPTGCGIGPRKYIFVDQYHPWLLFASLLLAILSISGGIFTLHLIEHGATEKNPLMAWFVSLGTTPFFTAKILLTCTPVLIFLVFHNYYSRLLHIQVKALIPASAAAFLLVLLWQLLLKFSMD